MTDDYEHEPTTLQTRHRELTAERARELLRYDVVTGSLYWRVNRPGGAKAGDVAGCFHRNTYRKACIDRRYYLVHRVIWLIVTGEWPKGEIDHIDGDGLNNRWENLRDVTGQVNNMNAPIRADNTSGVLGVYWDKRLKRWAAEIQANGKRKYLGSFKHLHDAAAARKCAEAEFGFHPNHGRNLTGAIPDLPPHEQAKAESIASSEEPLTKKQIRAAWVMIKKVENK